MHRLARVGERTRKHWGWGFEDQQPTREQIGQAAEMIERTLGIEVGDVEDPVALESLELPPPRASAPSHLRELCAQDVRSRASHALGKSYTDVVDGFRGRFEHPPDVVARPRDEREVELVLEWCSSERLAVIP
jgi:alkyldihydroxyacetonephosphate synthase